eukprot:TRINITY_DN797_c0_g1_i1.p1 TRINITY_DN797_c0_g1~~TRINITY_DN797_c0_g1_i1.p1  ORF type:complete len:476 (-),score=175.32 TRINITY_DN797_c0_g1_i1:11-1396(-)
MAVEVAEWLLVVVLVFFVIVSAVFVVVICRQRAALRDARQQLRDCDEIVAATQASGSARSASTSTLSSVPVGAHSSDDDSEDTDDNEDEEEDEDASSQSASGSGESSRALSGDSAVTSSTSSSEHETSDSSSGTGESSATHSEPPSGASCAVVDVASVTTAEPVRNVAELSCDGVLDNDTPVEGRRVDRDAWELSRDALRDIRQLATSPTSRIMLCELRVDDQLRQVACKVVNHDLLSARAQDEFLNEVKTLQRLRPSANVVQLHGVITHVPPFCIVMELCDGGSLDRWLAAHTSQVDVKLAGAFVVAACRGLRHLHRHGLVHRSISARTMLIDRNGGLKVAGFGMVRDLASGYRTESSGGPLRHTAPEALVQRVFSMATDVWSLGVLAWECFTPGGVPYAPLNGAQVALAVCKDGLRLQRPAMCPADLWPYISACWASVDTARPKVKQIEFRTMKICIEN